MLRHPAQNHIKWQSHLTCLNCTTAIKFKLQFSHQIVKELRKNSHRLCKIMCSLCLRLSTEVTTKNILPVWPKIWQRWNTKLVSYGCIIGTPSINDDYCVQAPCMRSSLFQTLGQSLERKQARKLQDAQAVKLTSWKANKLRGWQIHNLTNWKAAKLTRWEDDKMTGWQDDKMAKVSKSCE